MSSTENLLAAVADDPAAHGIGTWDIPLTVHHAGGRVDASTVSIPEDARPSEILKAIRNVAQGKMTRAEKAALALRLLKTKVYRVPIHPVDGHRSRHEADLANALKHPDALDADADAFFTKYNDFCAGDHTVLVEVSVDKSTLSVIGRAAIFAGGFVLQICLGV